MEDKNILLEFVKKTKDGEYARINEEDLKYSRLEELGEEDFNEKEEYYYNIR